MLVIPRRCLIASSPQCVMQGLLRCVSVRTVMRLIGLTGTSPHPAFVAVRCIDLPVIVGAGIGVYTGFRCWIDVK